MAASASKTAFVLVPGSFSYPAVWAKVVPYLTAAGCEAYPTALLSAGEREHGPATMQEDAASIHAVVAQLADQGKDIVLAMNSYGGIPGTEAAKGLGKKERQEQGKSGGLIGLVYIASFLAPVGSSLNRIMGAASGAAAQLPDNTNPYMDLDRDQMSKIIFSDLSEEDARAYAAEMPKHSTVSFTGELSYPAYEYIPTTYLLTENDNIVPTALQRSMIAAVEADGTQIKTVPMVSDHVPMLSHPKETSEVILGAAGTI